MGGVADQPLDVQGIADAANQVGRLVDDRDVVVFRGQIAGNAGTDLPGAADDDFHGVMTLCGNESRVTAPPLTGTAPPLSIVLNAQ